MLVIIVVVVGTVVVDIVVGTVVVMDIVVVVDADAIDISTGAAVVVDSATGAAVVVDSATGTAVVVGVNGVVVDSAIETIDIVDVDGIVDDANFVVVSVVISNIFIVVVDRLGTFVNDDSFIGPVIDGRIENEVSIPATVVGIRSFLFGRMTNPVNRPIATPRSKRRIRKKTRILVLLRCHNFRLDLLSERICSLKT